MQRKCVAKTRERVHCFVLFGKETRDGHVCVPSITIEKCKSFSLGQKPSASLFGLITPYKGNYIFQPKAICGCQKFWKVPLMMAHTNMMDLKSDAQ